MATRRQVLAGGVFVLTGGAAAGCNETRPVPQSPSSGAEGGVIIQTERRNPEQLPPAVGGALLSMVRVSAETPEGAKTKQRRVTTGVRIDGRTYVTADSLVLDENQRELMIPCAKIQVGGPTAANSWTSHAVNKASRKPSLNILRLSHPETSTNVAIAHFAGPLAVGSALYLADYRPQRVGEDPSISTKTKRAIYDGIYLGPMGDNATRFGVLTGSQGVRSYGDFNAIDSTANSRGGLVVDSTGGLLGLTVDSEKIAVGDIEQEYGVRLYNDEARLAQGTTLQVTTVQAVSPALMNEGFQAITTC